MATLGPRPLVGEGDRGMMPKGLEDQRKKQRGLTWGWKYDSESKTPSHPLLNAGLEEGHLNLPVLMRTSPLDDSEGSG